MGTCFQVMTFIDSITGLGIESSWPVGTKENLQVDGRVLKRFRTRKILLIGCF